MMPEPALLEEVTRLIWAEMLSRPDLTRATARIPGAEVSAEIEINGSFNGTLVLGLSVPVATEVSARWLDRPAAELGSADLDDVVLELANMIAGNVKSCLGGPNVLSIPRMISQRTHPRGALIFDDGAGQVTVSLTPR